MKPKAELPLRTQVVIHRPTSMLHGIKGVVTDYYDSSEGRMATVIQNGTWTYNVPSTWLNPRYPLQVKA